MNIFESSIILSLDSLLKKIAWNERRDKQAQIGTKLIAFIYSVKNIDVILKASGSISHLVLLILEMV